MKKLGLPLLCLMAFVLKVDLSAKSSGPFKDLKKATEKSCFEELTEWQRAYGPFDADQAKRQIKQGKVQAADYEMGQIVIEASNNCLSQKAQYEITAVMDGLGIACDAHLLQNENESQDAQSKTLHQCYEAEGPEMVVITRTLEIEVNVIPKVVQKKVVCQGHHEKKHYSSKSDAKRQEKEWVDAYSKDPTIKSYRIDFEGSFWKGYDVTLHYTHQNNDSNCDNSKKIKKVKQKKIKQITKEEWREEPESYQTLLQDPDATFIHKQCLDVAPSKTINGLLVERPCWKEQYAFLRKRETPLNTECDALRNRLCKLVKSVCVQGQEDQCQLWELTFECLNQSQSSIVDPFNKEVVPIDSKEPNPSFNEVVAKLAIFKEMKEELVASKSRDPLTLEIFKGSKKQCNKSIASDVIYDCCFSYSGLAKQIGLAKCDANEIALASLREEGQCHYIGVKEDKFLDLMTTNYEHVFCCFPTKLGRVLNEQARKQLHIDWGTAKHPQCQGLTVQQVQALDFDQLNLEEVFEKDLNDLDQRYTDKTKNLKDPSHAQKNIDEIKNKMTDRLKEIHAN